MDKQALPEAAVEQYGRAIGQLLVAEIAADESDLYSQIIESYRTAVISQKRRQQDNPLALGLGEILALASPLAYEAGNRAYNRGAFSSVSRGRCHDC
jgi:hypothetical protein